MYVVKLQYYTKTAVTATTSKHSTSKPTYTTTSKHSTSHSSTQLVLPSTPLLHLLILLPQNIQLLSPPMPLVQNTQLQNHLFQLLLPNIQLMILPQSLFVTPQHLQLLVNTPSTSLTSHQNCCYFDFMLKQCM